MKKVRSLTKKKQSIEAWYSMMKDMMKRYTYRRIMRFSLHRGKIQMMAKDQGYTVPQYFFLSIYHTVEDWPEENPDEQEVKFTSLMYLLGILDKSSYLNDLFDVLDLASVRRL